MLFANILLGLTFFSFLICIWAVYMFYRNQQIFQYKGMLLNKISNKISEDMDNYYTECRKNRKKNPLGFQWKWRYTAYEKVTYQEMFWKFWKPLNSFYKDLSFIE